MTAKAPRTKEPTEPPKADVVPIAKGRERRSRDYSQRALDVVREATARHEDEDEASE